jgi:hypothetical protein
LEQRPYSSDHYLTVRNHIHNLIETTFLTTEHLPPFLDRHPYTTIFADIWYSHFAEYNIRLDNQPVYKPVVYNLTGANIDVLSHQNTILLKTNQSTTLFNDIFVTTPNIRHHSLRTLIKNFRQTNLICYLKSIIIWTMQCILPYHNNYVLLHCLLHTLRLLSYIFSNYASLHCLLHTLRLLSHIFGNYALKIQFQPYFTDI